MIGITGTGGEENTPRNVVPSLVAASPRLRFHLGQTANNMPVISPTLPNMPGSASSWYVSQWNQSSYISPTMLQNSNQTTFDIYLNKLAQYAFEAPDGHSHVWIYEQANSWVYELYETGGVLTPNGGSNLFLTTDQLVHTSFSVALSLDFDAKISRATLYGSPQAQSSGALLSQVFSGFSLMFTDPVTGDRQWVYMQIPISGSYSPSRNAKFFCSGKTISLFNPALTKGELLLPFVANAGPLQHFHYNLNAYLAQLLSSSSCGVKWSATQSNPSNWSVVGFYIGL